jgi:sigma-B regulation protein RsbU (phosphoserine phosphatase)
MKIIVAEDDPVSRARLASILQTMGHAPAAFANGLEAWKEFDREPARLIISDWMMPELDGLELCTKVRERPKTEYTYFMLVTGEHTTDADYDRAIQANVDDFLIKPLERGAIWRRLRVAERILTYATELRQLKTLIPICMYCKKIRDDSDYWNQMENYIHEHTGSDFSHGICPECYEKVMNSEFGVLPGEASKIG